ncbi:hypothetical protein CHUAL_004499 [Chamberlinius hualienensis]
MSYSEDHVRNKLSKELEPSHLEVEDFSDGCGAKFNVLIVSSKFEGKSLLDRQRMVNAVLEEEMKTIHALTQKTYTTEQWEKMKAKNI